MTHSTPAVNTPEIPASFRAAMARAIGDARLRGVPFSPTQGERVTLGDTVYAVELLETGGFVVESGKAQYTVTITDLNTGLRAEYANAWAKTRRAKTGAVKHHYSQKSVGGHKSWGALLSALVAHAAQRWQGQVAA
ncbi:hypothetical protein [Deinococcus radiotolerans]|uniref:Uncharacterized protein n=1 Tax=Deinococcus radiotolerans TaxID=1309407 RepID=A0ABQ2FQ33_9DEIO|nr:hypothetical protein [Deinococcus radiotolerans]GGL15559.1 hypothetical protein GCM10010844_38050 [Deinococcus radiotolerans]